MRHVLEKFQILEEEVGFSGGTKIVMGFLSLKFLSIFLLNYPFFRRIGQAHGYR